VRAVLRDRPKLEASIRAFIAKREAEDAAGTQQALRYDGLPAEIQERIRVMLAAEKGESAQASPTVLSD
jgi:hypothetical protein